MVIGDANTEADYDYNLENNDKEEEDVNAPPDRFAGTADFQPQAPQVPLQGFFYKSS